MRWIYSKLNKTREFCFAGSQTGRALINNALIFHMQFIIIPWSYNLDIATQDPSACWIGDSCFAVVYLVISWWCLPLNSQQIQKYCFFKRETLFLICSLQIWMFKFQAVKSQPKNSLELYILHLICKPILGQDRLYLESCGSWETNPRRRESRWRITARYSPCFGICRLATSILI